MAALWYVPNAKAWAELLAKAQLSAKARVLILVNSDRAGR
jgi:hypothetical protein